MLFLFNPSVVAGTLVEIQKNNELTTAITDGQKVRMDTSPSEYVILDSSDHSVKIVNQQKQLVTVVNIAEANTDNNHVVKTSIASQGQGRKVAGYSTRKFSYTANGKYCGVLYGSINAIETNGVKELLTAMKIMMARQRAALGGFASLVDACTLADMQLVDYVNTVGLPMRTEKNGRVELEIKAIKTDVALADDAFAIPAAYKTVDMSGKVIPARQNIVEAKQAAANIEERPQDYQRQRPRIQHQGQPQSQSRNMARQIRQPRQIYPQSPYQRRYVPRMMGQY